jgi:hypothetical protein
MSLMVFLIIVEGFSDETVHPFLVLTFENPQNFRKKS